MKVLITGGAGFIGGNIALYLYERGYQVSILDNFERASPIISNLIREKNIKVYNEDLRYSQRLEEIIEEYDVIVHAAAYVDVKESIERPWDYIENNYYSTYRLSSILRKSQRLIYLSSAAVYGDVEKIPVREDSPKKPLSPYGLSKLLGEEIILLNARCIGFRAVILRLFNVYGLGQNKSYAGVISIFIDRVLRDQPPLIFGDGMNIRDFIHVRDVSRVVEMTIERSDVSGVFNVGSGRGVSIRELAELIIRLSERGDRVKPQYTDPRPGDIRESVADISRLKNILGFTPEIDLESGLIELIRLWREVLRTQDLNH
ncbi:MAG: NAD-dependent epimerase/dehydratase family protein [Sulfolobales archaeon]